MTAKLKIADFSNSLQEVIRRIEELEQHNQYLAELLLGAVKASDFSLPLAEISTEEALAIKNKLVHFGCGGHQELGIIVKLFNKNFDYRITLQKQLEEVAGSNK